MTVLANHYNTNRYKIESIIDLAKVSKTFNVSLVYIELNERFDDIYLALGELLLTLACPEVINAIPKDHRYNEVSYAISSSRTLNQDVQELKRHLQKPIRE
ncbi:hypothetical protein ACRTC3_11725 [Photobacterium damselae]|uniref:hypothetical protein n=1 Tax=Photobacterium damselae TaxID=38293 RepID=UPI00354F056F